ncbi:hypothetical protein V6N11_031820 [Hibiscus sabdariffa]|uniref:Uncharacterized protein n=1 Tax=Hibiscus sabdariffa TaxID=183260 RepID=A0ABR2SYR7_9ROSI
MTWSECRSPLAVKTHGKLRRKSHLHFSCLPSSLAFVGGIDANFGTSTPFRSKPRPCVARFLSFEGRRNSRRNSRFSCNGKLRLSPLHSPLSTLQLASPLSPVEEVNNRYGRDLLLLVNDRDDNTVSPHQIIYHEGKFLVALEDLKPVHDHFLNKMHSWRETGLHDENSWFNFVEADIRNLLKNVLRILFNGIDKGTYNDLHADLATNILISNSGEHVKLLPLSVTPNSGVDLDQLRILVSKMIGLPFKLTEISKNSRFNLPGELSTLLSLLNNNNLLFVSPKFLLKPPFVWSTKDKIDFIQNLDHLIKMKTIVALDLDKVLEKDGILKDWKMLVEKNSIFKAMLGYDSYPRAIDLVRFCGNAYRHYNDESYRHLRTCYLEKFEIEKELAIVFPEIYLKLFGGLFEYARLFWIYHNRR